MPRYRIYALIHGQVLPTGTVANCGIEKMSFEEQDIRKFSPIQGEFTDDMTREYKTYVTSLPHVEALKIRAEYVAIHDIEERDPLAALGGGIRAFEELCRYLFLANVEDIQKKFEGKIGHASTYLYQIVKIYEIDAEGNEKDAQYKIRNGHVFLPNRPDATEWRHPDTSSFLNAALSFHDEIFKRALAYLYMSSIGHFVLHSPEKIALDHFKSIEVIVNSLSDKRYFTERLDDTAVLISLTPEEVERISKLWKDRSNGDVAHSKEFGISDRYPNQFPIPSNAQYSGSYPDSVAERICIKYYQYRKNLYSVETDFEEDASEEGEFSTINAMWETNRLGFYTKPIEEKELSEKLKKRFAEEFGIEESKLDMKSTGRDKISNNLTFTIHVAI
jgi:hypothetical protein